MAIKINIHENDASQTLINFLKKYFKEESLSRIYHLFYSKKIKVNAKRITNFKYRLHEGDELLIYDDTLQRSKIHVIVNPQLSFNIVYEDQNILIVVKDHGILTHNVNLVSLDSAVRYYLKNNKSLELNSTFTVSHCYRLDKMTKGLVIYTKNKASQIGINSAQIEKKIIKKYYAVVSGKFDEKIKLSGSIFKDEQQQKMVFSLNEKKISKTCETIFTPIITFNNFSLIECQLITGRKHQIRASLQFLNFPIVGDFKYGSKVVIKEKILLFAYLLEFKNIEKPLNYLNDKKVFMKNLKAELISLIKNDLYKKC